MADSQSPAENVSAEVDPAEATPADQSATESAPEDKLPKLDGPADPERLMRLVANTRADNEKLKAKLDEALAKLGEKEEAEKSEYQRLTERAETAERELAKLRTEALVSKVARKHGLPDELAEFLTGETEEEIEAKAERLAAAAGTKRAELPGKPKPKLVPGNGSDADPGEVDPEAIAKKVRERL